MKNLFTIYALNLGTYKGGYFDIANLDDLKEAESKVNPTGGNDVEIQIIDTNFESYTYEYGVLDFLRIVEDTEVDPSELSALIQIYGVEEARTVLEKGIFYVIYEVDDSLEAFKEYVKEIDLLEVPDHLAYYIDWEAVKNDYECNGLIIDRLDYVHYIIAPQYY